MEYKIVNIEVEHPALDKDDSPEANSSKWTDLLTSLLILFLMLILKSLKKSQK